MQYQVEEKAAMRKIVKQLAPTKTIGLMTATLFNFFSAKTSIVPVLARKIDPCLTLPIGRCERSQREQPSTAKRSLRKQAIALIITVLTLHMTTQARGRLPV